MPFFLTFRTLGNETLLTSSYGMLLILRGRKEREREDGKRKRQTTAVDEFKP